MAAEQQQISIQSVSCAGLAADAVAPRPRPLVGRQGWVSSAQVLTARQPDRRESLSSAKAGAVGGCGWLGGCPVQSSGRSAEERGDDNNICVFPSPVSLRRPSFFRFPLQPVPRTREQRQQHRHRHRHRRRVPLPQRMRILPRTRTLSLHCPGSVGCEQESGSESRIHGG